MRGDDAAGQGTACVKCETYASYAGTGGAAGRRQGTAYLSTDTLRPPFSTARMCVYFWRVVPGYRHRTYRASGCFCGNRYAGPGNVVPHLCEGVTQVICQRRSRPAL